MRQRTAGGSGGCPPGQHSNPASEFLEDSGPGLAW
jgi:hypothetical protein